MANTFPLLERINGPEDLKKLSRPELEELPAEVRAFILEKLAPVGGHLASSLGVVELTIALHTVFSTPDDKIIWDVGHQCYPHKILTGRRDRFETIRQKEGLSGFPKRKESSHDAFDTGHASTSISAALGMAVARDLDPEKNNKVIAVIGDGSMASGMAFEGLNNAGHLDRDLVVVLNDNEMSISPNVGALSSYLSRVMTGDFYSKMRNDVQELLRALPMGEKMAKLAKKVEEHAKGFISEGMLFEELGFTYVGPIDGHNMDHLLTAFQNIRKFEKPTLVHVVTTKGKGFSPAEAKPASFHGVGPFDPCNGQAAKAASCAAPQSYTSAFSCALLDQAEKDEKIVAITAAMPEGTGLDAFAEKFPDRFFDVGIAEEHAVTFAAGLAAEGFRPVVAIYSTFMQRGYDQIIHDVALQGLPVVFALDRAGLVGADGPTHHGVFDLSFMRSVPGMTVMAPSDEDELQHALATALALDGPAALRYPRGAGQGVEMAETLTPWPLGKGRMISGGDVRGGVAVLVAGTALSAAREGVDRAKGENIPVQLFDARFVKPLDEEMILKLARDCDGLVTVEENSRVGGFGSAVLELLSDHGICKPIRRMGLPDRFVEHGPQTELLRDAGLDADAIFDSIHELSLETSRDG
jgi:1-deoxy-D-xylulose-5-phosphate synthase